MPDSCLGEFMIIVQITKIDGVPVVPSRLDDDGTQDGTFGSSFSTSVRTTNHSGVTWTSSMSGI